MSVWVAYNHYGDLVAEAENENDLLRILSRYGIDEDDVTIGVVTA